MTKDALTHLDDQGNAVMVDVSGKAVTEREAVAGSRITMSAEAFEALTSDASPKGDVMAAARIAGIMAAKKTSDLIPLCHPLPLSKVAVTLETRPDELAVDVKATARTSGQTGVEMEALMAATVASLTLYDMLKAVDKTMTIGNVRLLKKSGGKSGTFERVED
ncbi:Molybdenum cofactor biosynthesis protein MoaC [Candidatus Phaeomarinobacter ectocarpi]|uniref:Cyclic pyranopterin monophosphate synthase n=1 Tax=Candidatus Phaeomarinibacter ectocarpi TaxID=1458461 RepID=X5MN61_9HYPH|nr:cyclic pyranopterin monophosphate synthase MoaC [Candidatus Phaeomarinobacter ectocarpi]CDO61015.1 Molybdenum cofactor biosynthesis protein MoaC [Candidatus Phaeomarinobacter ectocarpi]